MKRLAIRLIALTAVLGAAWGGYALFKQLPQRQQQVPTAKVRRGDVVIRAYARGELRAVRSVTLTAPNLFGTVQVTRLAPLGAMAHEKDLIVEFDDSERRAQLEETELEVAQIDEQIKKAQADLAIRGNQDQVDLLKAQYAVRRAELEVQRNELLAEIDARKNILNLEEARRKLKQLESDVKSRQEQALAQIAVLRETRNKSMIDVAREKQRIAQAKLLSPMTGLVAIRQNRGQGFFFPGMQIPDIREGDTLQPGMPVADVLDLSELEVIARVGELDRANLHEGQDVSIRLDAVPNKQFRGKIKSMSATASANIFSGDPAKKFDVVFSIDMQQLLTALGAKPEDVKRILAAAERNAKKAPAAPALPAMAAGGARRGPTAPATTAGGRMMAAAAPGGPGGAAAQLSAGGPQMLFVQRPGAPGGGTPGAAQPGNAPGGGTSGALPAPQAGGPGAMDFTRLATGASIVGTEEERANAKLPSTPEEDTQLDVLIRPGLLADVEITVETIADAVHIAGQGLFEKNGKHIVYVQTNGRFQERPVKLARRSESTLVISEGLKADEVIALADPFARKADRKTEKKTGGAGMPGMSSGGAGKGGK